MGSEHARNIMANQNAILAGIADEKKNLIDAFFKENNYKCDTFSSYKKLLASDIDGVVIASPNSLHAEMCIEAASLIFLSIDEAKEVARKLRKAVNIMERDKRCLQTAK
jgi:hypothetical protein